MPTDSNPNDTAGTTPAEARLRNVVQSLNDRLVALVGHVGLTSERFWALVRSFALSFVGGLAFLWLKLPLPWLLGPLSAALIGGVLHRPLARPVFLLLPMRAVIGVAIGASFTPDLWAKGAGVVSSLGLMIPYMILVSYFGAKFLTRFAKFDGPTAFFASGPGGLADMAILAGDAGGNMRQVGLVQAVRLLVTVFVVPFWLQFAGHNAIGGRLPDGLHLLELQLVDALIIAAIAYVGWFIATRIGLIGAPTIGPLILSAVLHGAGLTSVRVPVEILIVAQLTIGIVIGHHFVGVTLREFVTIMSWGLAFGLALVASAGAVSLAISHLTGLDSTTLLLSYAPGGQNEMSIMALVMHLDVAIVAIHHLVRVILVVIGAQLVLKSRKDWRRPA